MIRRAFGFWLILLLPFWASPAQATDSVSFTGNFVQGGLAIGHTLPGARVRFAGKQVRVSAEGLFLIGFGRDAGPTTSLEVVIPGGMAESRILTIGKRDYDIQRIEGLPQKKVTPDAVALKRINADNALIRLAREEDRDRADFSSGFDWPLRGRVSGVYGSQRILNGKPRNPHNGVDIAAPEGTLITVPASGVVAMAHEDMFFTGKTVMLDHGHGLTSVYAHMSEILVKQGQWVAKGASLGRVGRSGRATGAHLHWGVTWFKTHLDPMLLTGPMPRVTPKP